MRGATNPNFGNAAQNRHREKFLAAVKKRGQPWTEKHRREHSERMLGVSNKMRGKKHTAETKRVVSEKKIAMYKAGQIKFSAGAPGGRISSPERKIVSYLASKHYQPVMQFQVRGLSYYYDVFVPWMNLIIEFNGDYWHAHPEKYSSDAVIGHRSNPRKASDIWQRDAAKIASASEAGYLIEVVWQKDFVRDGHKAVDAALCKAYREVFVIVEAP